MQAPCLYDIVYNQLNLFLEQHKLKKTPERFTILRIIASESRTYDIEQIDTELKKKKYFLSKATIYNTLHLFEQANIVERVWVNKKVAYQCVNTNLEPGVYLKKGHIVERLNEEIEKEILEMVEKKTNYKISKLFLFTNEL